LIREENARKKEDRNEYEIEEDLNKRYAGLWRENELIFANYYSLRGVNLNDLDKTEDIKPEEAKDIALCIINDYKSILGDDMRRNWSEDLESYLRRFYIGVTRDPVDKENRYIFIISYIIEK
jgi:hypothetical protein